MEHWWIGWQMSKIRQKQLLQEAARFRLHQEGNKRVERSRGMRRKSGTRQPEAHRRRRLVALRDTLGQRLIDWGTFLRQHRALTRDHGFRAERG
jgi:hypothetical protein